MKSNTQKEEQKEQIPMAGFTEQETQKMGETLDNSLALLQVLRAACLDSHVQRENISACLEFVIPQIDRVAECLEEGRVIEDD